MVASADVLELKNGTVLNAVIDLRLAAASPLIK